MKHVHINLANGTIDLDDLYQLENRATMLTIDYTDCNVDDHNKFVEFELSDGEKLRYKAGRAGQLICSLPLDRYVMKEGKLLINPIAILSNPDADYDDPIQSFVSFKTFEVMVMPTINALGEGSEKANDVLDPIIIQLGTQQDWIDAEAIRQSTQDQRLAVVEGNEDELFFRLKGLEAGLPDPSGAFNEINLELDDHEARITDTEARLGTVEPKVSTLEGEMNAVELKTQHIPVDGSFNPTSNKGSVLRFQTLANISALPVNWAGLIQINAMSDTTIWFAKKLTASDTGNNSVWFLNSTSTTGDSRIVGFSLDGIFLNYKIASKGDGDTYSSRLLEGSDLNNATELGSYRLGGASGSFTNAPTAAGNYGYLQNISHVGDPYSYQTFHNMNTQTTYARYKNSSGWTPWIALATENHVADEITKRTTPLYKYVANQNLTIDQVIIDISHAGLYILYGWQPNAAQNPCAYLIGTAYNNNATLRLTHLGGFDVIKTEGKNLRCKVEGAGYWQFNIYKIV